MEKTTLAFNCSLLFVINFFGETTCSLLPTPPFFLFPGEVIRTKLERRNVSSKGFIKILKRIKVDPGCRPPEVGRSTSWNTFTSPSRKVTSPLHFPRAEPTLDIQDGTIPGALYTCSLVTGLFH